MIQVLVKPSLKKLKERNEKRIGKLKDMATPFKKVSIFLDRWVQQNFRTEGGKVGGWKTIARQGKILQDTGRLRASYLPFATNKNAGIGSDLPYAKKHEEGIGVAKRRTLPEKSEVIDDATKIMEKHVGGALK